MVFAPLSLENPAFLTTSCRNDRGTQWATATMTPDGSISTAKSSWSSMARPSPVTLDADDAAGEADQDRGEGRDVREVRRAPVGGGVGAPPAVRGDSEAR